MTSAPEHSTFQYFWQKDPYMPAKLGFTVGLPLSVLAWIIMNWFPPNGILLQFSLVIMLLASATAAIYGFAVGIFYELERSAPEIAAAIKTWWAEKKKNAQQN